MKTRVSTIIASCILCVLMLGGLTIAPAHADDFHDTQRAIRRDINAIRNDDARIKALMHKKNDQLRHHDWRNARGTQQHIDYAHLDLNRDRALLRADQRAMARLGHR